MEPQLPSPSIGPERAPSLPERGAAPFLTPEAAPAPHSGERQEAHEGQPGGPSDPGPQVQPLTPPPLPQLQTATPGTPAQQVDDNPAMAADEDLIEKEWVEKAKKVIAETKHDPFLQEQAVSKLQADYLQKRYNKTVKVPNESS